MKKINVSQPIMMLDGTPIVASSQDTTPFTVGKAIANILLASKTKKFDAFKAYSIAKRFYETTELELDDADFAIVIEIIQSDESYNALVNGQVLEVLNNLK